MSKPILYREPIADSVTRKCKVCEEVKELNLEFHYHSTSECYSGICKDCHNLRRRLKWAGKEIPHEFTKATVKRKNRRISQNKPYRKTTYANRKRLNYKSLDKKRNLDHNLSLEFLQVALESPCIYCGFNAVGLDRKDNSKGHTEENSVPCCFECNIARNENFSYEEMLLIGRTIREVKQRRIQ
jgi:hypothetical protein